MTATRAELDIRTPDGVCHAWLHGGGGGRRPAVLLYPDAFGVRPAMHDAADRLAALGFAVLVPDTFYREGKVPPFDAATAFTEPKERDRLMALVRTVTPERARVDAGAFLDLLAARPDVDPARVGATGYCMGGRLAYLAAARHPERVRAAASVHGGGLVTDAPDSPHLLAGQVKAQLYFAVADEDRTCTPEHQGALAAALGAAHVEYRIELYRGKRHGFAVSDAPVFDRDAADRHWRRLEAFFRETLG